MSGNWDWNIVSEDKAEWVIFSVAALIVAGAALGFSDERALCARAGCGETPAYGCVLKGRGFSRAVSAVKSMSALAAEGRLRTEERSFRNLLVHPRRFRKVRIQVAAHR